MQECEAVSIVMCTYNGEKFLIEQIDSIINQTYPIYELIIQDDHSIDNTWDILKSYQQRYHFVKIFQNKRSIGVNENFFSAIKRATGDYIALSDQDDIWEPYKIERQIGMIGNKMLSSGFSKPFANGEGIKIHFDQRIPNFNLERVVYVSSLAGHTMLFKKEFIAMIPDINLWSPHFMYDHLFQIIAAAYDSISFCDCVLVHQRRHISAATYGEPSNYSKTLLNILRMVKQTYFQYRSLRPFIRSYFSQVYELLSSLPKEAIAKDDACLMALYQSGRSFMSFLRLECICVRLRNKIVYSKEHNMVFSFLRALYFPVSCSEYFRYMLNND